MRPNSTKKKLNEGRVVFGAMGTMIDPAVVEMIGLAGYDFCFIDMEHVSTNLLLIEHMCRAADAVGVSPLVRVADDNPKTILRVLEIGVHGIIVPHVMSGADARRLVQAVRYPPTGTRGISAMSRAAQYTFGDFDVHMREADREVLLIGLIEDREAVEDIEAILSTPGLDVAFIAPYDLAGSLGHPDEPNHLDTLRAVERVLETARQVGGTRICAPANHRMYSKSVPELIELGVSMIVTVQDSVLLAQALKRDIDSLALYRR